MKKTQNQKGAYSKKFESSSNLISLTIGRRIWGLTRLNTSKPLDIPRDRRPGQEQRSPPARLKMKMILKASQGISNMQFVLVNG